MYFGYNGFNKFNPMVFKNSIPPKVEIVGFKVFTKMLVNEEIL